MNRKAVTKMQAMLLAFIVVVAAVSVSVTYFLWSGQKRSAETIKIGVVTDLDMVRGKAVWEAIVLAAEQINAEGGVLGRNITVIGEDSDSETGEGDIAKGIAALERLITYHEVDFIITSDLSQYILPYQDIVAEHNKILLDVWSSDEELTQRVIDDYKKYKLYFRVWTPNSTSVVDSWVDSLLTLRNYNGFNKAAYIVEDIPATNAMTGAMDYYLPEVHGFDLVYKGKCPLGTLDFTSYFAAAEESGAEIMFCMIITQAGIPFVKEWYDRQSPFVIWGFIGAASGVSDFWDLTDGKCANIVFSVLPATVGYPLTSKTVALHDAYIDRWGETPTGNAPPAYDAVRFILYDALERAGTTEADAVIEALEKTDIETSGARRFVFTSSHDVMVGSAGPNRPGEDYVQFFMFQWQNGTQVPVYPKSIMEEAGATYTFPDWPGPWD